MLDRVLRARPEWRRTGAACFPAAAVVDGQWWVLRLNGFPDHPLWTLFVNGPEVRFDTTGLPPAWGRPLDPSVPPLEPHLAQEALAPLRDLAVYGSEAGDPCDDEVCCGRARTGS
ncbi:hypothetical protein [Amycolatopsis anabasis]|uniref:hypothetical protein n=1 Tax=Amycolatopsis anabasis TaxID=1840409 RepID=UPI00131D5BC6|nr:hypothetical protein [Amycolatopsis anabasis]